MKNKTLYNLIAISCLINILFAVSIILIVVCGYNQPWTAIFITLFMFAYHADIRILIGIVTNNLFKNKINIDKKCYKISTGEFTVLNKLGVKKWKSKFITMFKSQFEVAGFADIEGVLRNNINAEITHHLCFVFGLLAVLFGWMISAEELWLYVITSVVASLALDLPPILIQRYNRYRLLKIKNSLKGKL